VPEHVVLLHGFAGTRRAWDGVAGRLDRERYLPLALDLPGHGAAAGWEGAITFDACVEYVLDAAPARFALCGYSMGGRIALQVAFAAPERVGRLVLVSTSAGIEDARERAARAEADERLARRLEQEPYEHFIERWRSQPMFAADPLAVDELARADQRRNQPRALAAALRGVGTGEMQSLWGRLSELRMPASVVVGERDAKFLALGRRLVAELDNAALVVLPGGHVLPLENPAALAQVLAADARGRY
jgi:2-succinyl-6-hydroxy-2,4-cyclohexadiene-1-carboxylate synthase